MNLQERKEILVRLGKFLQSADEEWIQTKKRATAENGWFIPEFIDLSVEIVTRFLREEKLQKLIERFNIPQQNPPHKKVGVVMASHLPMAGIHDLLSVFLTGHFAFIKLSPKDATLPKFLIKKMIEWNQETASYFTISDMLKARDAYMIATDNKRSNSLAQYFQKYPHIIRKTKSSVAILTGDETDEELEKLADDVYQFFGMSASNVSQVFVPEGYDFENLLTVFKKYKYLIDHTKYKNNYDYNLAVLLLNKQFYMSNGSILLVENASSLSPVSQLHYQYYNDVNKVRKNLQANEFIQNIVSKEDIPFGRVQNYGISEQAETKVLEFLLNLS